MNTRKDDTPGRKIFQPDLLTNYLINGFAVNRNSIGDLVNIAIKKFFTPTTPELKRLTDKLFDLLMMSGSPVEPSEEDIKHVLAEAIKCLKDHPIEDRDALAQIVLHFNNGYGTNYHEYTYICEVDNARDEILRNLNFMLKTVDDDYCCGYREFYRRADDVISHWDELCMYEETYIALSILIELADICYPIDTYRAVCLILMLDESIAKSPAIKSTVPFEISVTLKDIYSGIEYELLVYESDNGYAYLSGDHGFENMPEDIRAYYQKIYNRPKIHGEVSQEELEQIRDLEAEGRRLFSRLPRIFNYDPKKEENK